MAPPEIFSWTPARERNGELGSGVPITTRRQYGKCGSTANHVDIKLPPRVDDNVDGDGSLAVAHGRVHLGTVGIKKNDLPEQAELTSAMLRLGQGDPRCSCQARHTSSGRFRRP
jgi:hypothetical protein